MKWILTVYNHGQLGGVQLPFETRDSARQVAVEIGDELSTGNHYWIRQGDVLVYLTPDKFSHAVVTKGESE